MPLLTAQPSFTWSITAGVGSVNGTGLYNAPAASGSATIQAASGAVNGSANITVNPALFNVTTNSDSGAGSLRQAILDANAAPPQDDTILFAIPGTAAQTINLLSALPLLLNDTTLLIPTGGSYQYEQSHSIAARSAVRRSLLQPAKL